MLPLSCANEQNIVASHDIERQLELQEQDAELEDFISKLPPKEQKVISMYVLEDKNYKEIGANTGLTQGSIRILVMRAKNKIKQRFSNKQ